MAKQATRRQSLEPKKRLKIKIKKNDMVKVITGRDKGKTGRVLDVNRETGRVLVEGVMMVKKHVRPNPQRGIKGGVAERESTIHASNVMLMTSNGKTTRIGAKVEVVGGKAKRTRIARKSGESLDKK
ncbi:MAG TPA: 50S ribosomal protein L24 [Solibacterales bacterium]|nr:50S ribosomal protein L24 [Bryobacterales bacterium]